MLSVRLLRNSLFVFVAVIAATPGLTHRAAAAPDDTLGMALMSATVSEGPSPTILRGSGAVSVSRASTGIADVAFDRDISNCTCTASIGNYNNAVSYSASIATANCPLAATNTVRVATTFRDGTFEDYPFHLIVFCPK